MLKITAIHGEDQPTLVLEGKLVEPWVAELQKSWAQLQGESQPREILIDLKDVTAISQSGEDLLLQMMRDGATFRCCRGLLTRHVVKQLQRRRSATQKG